MIKFLNQYPIIEDSCLPEEVKEELCNKCPGNDSGRIINPDYHPVFKAWLEDQAVRSDVRYIVWWSW